MTISSPLIPTWVDLFFWLSMALALASGVACWLVFRDVNRTKSPQDRTIFFGFKKGSLREGSADISRFVRTMNEYERSFPQGKKLFWFKVLFVTAGWLFGLWFFLVWFVARQTS